VEILKQHAPDFEWCAVRRVISNMLLAWFCLAFTSNKFRILKGRTDEQNSENHSSDKLSKDKQAVVRITTIKIERRSRYGLLQN
jgi:hypothetical protein